MAPTSSGTTSTIIHVGPINMELSAAIEAVHTARQALTEVGSLCKSHWGYNSPNLDHLANETLGRAEGCLVAIGRQINKAADSEDLGNQADLRKALAQLHERFDNIGGVKLEEWISRNTKELFLKQQMLLNALHEQLQKALSSETDTATYRAIFKALEYEHARQASAADLWCTALVYMEQARHHYNTARQLTVVLFGMELPPEHATS